MELLLGTHSVRLSATEVTIADRKSTRAVPVGAIVAFEIKEGSKPAMVLQTAAETIRLRAAPDQLNELLAFMDEALQSHRTIMESAGSSSPYELYPQPVQAAFQDGRAEERLAATKQWANERAAMESEWEVEREDLVAERDRLAAQLTMAQDQLEGESAASRESHRAMVEAAEADHAAEVVAVRARWQERLNALSSEHDAAMDEALRANTDRLEVQRKEHQAQLDALELERRAREDDAKQRMDLDAAAFGEARERWTAQRRRLESELESVRAEAADSTQTQLQEQAEQFAKQLNELKAQTAAAQTATQNAHATELGQLRGRVFQLETDAKTNATMLEHGEQQRITLEATTTALQAELGEARAKIQRLERDAKHQKADAADHETQIEAVRGRWRVRLAALEKDHGVAMEALVAQLAKEEKRTAAFSQKEEKRRSALEEKHAAELKSLQLRHEESLGVAKANVVEHVAAAEEIHAAEKKSIHEAHEADRDAWEVQAQQRLSDANRRAHEERAELEAQHALHHQTQQEEIHALKAELKAARRQRTAAQTKAKKLDAAKASSQARLAELETSVSRLEADAASNHKELKRLRQRAELAQKDAEQAAQWERELVVLRAQSRDLERQLADARKDAAAFETRASILETRLADDGVGPELEAPGKGSAKRSYLVLD